MLKIICFLFSFLIFSSLLAQEISKDGKRKRNSEVSGAELIITFQKSITGDQQRLIQMNSRIKQLQIEIVELTTYYEKLDVPLEKDPDKGVLTNEKMNQVLRSLDLHLRSRQALSQQMILVHSKIDKQKELLNYISNGQIAVNEDSVNLTLAVADSASEGGINSELQNRKELAAIQELHVLEAKLNYSKQNLQLVDQLIRKHKEDFELTKLLTKTTTALKVLLEQESRDGAGRLYLPEISRRYSQDSLLLSSLSASIQTLEAYRPPIVEIVSAAEKTVETARSQLEFLQSSIAPHRVVYWLKTNLPSIAIILLAFFVIWLVTRWLITLILNKFIKSRSNAESADRLETLKLASGSIITILVVIIVFLMLLSQIGVDLTVVLGGAAVLSLVIAFGAQSLVKDYLSGFIILLENQYRAGNVVKINQTTGIVENMTLRLTVLRDLEGITHFIPHGHINEISNLTHHWSRVSFEIGISYNEKVDEVMMILKEIGAEIKGDPEFRSLIIGDLEMLGVDKFADSAIIIRFLVKTYPLKQWIIKREFLRRIKNRFDELGIEIPFPHLTVYHRQPEKQFDTTSTS